MVVVFRIADGVLRTPYCTGKGWIGEKNDTTEGLSPKDSGGEVLTGFLATIDSGPFWVKAACREGLADSICRGHLASHRGDWNGRRIIALRLGGSILSPLSWEVFKYMYMYICTR